MTYTLTKRRVPNRAEFDRLWSAWRVAYKREQDYLRLLEAKYFWASAPTTWATRTERAKLDRLSAREAALGEKCYRWLEVHSPRNWRSCVPVGWVCNVLRYEDAITADALSVVPMGAYGTSAAMMKQFASAIDGRQHSREEER